MVQHLLLLAVAAPLLVVGEPVTVMTQALPDHMRRKVRPVVRRIDRSQTSTRGWLAWTVVAFVAQHRRARRCGTSPALYDAAVAHTAVHALEHVTFVVTAALFWWMALGAGRRSRRGLGVLAVFVATLPATALGILDDARPRRPGTRRTAAVADRAAGPAGRGRRHVGLRRVCHCVVGAAALFVSWLTNMDRDRRRRERSDSRAVGAVVIRRLVRWFDDRLGASRFARSALNKVFPDHWSFMLGEIALYCFVVLVLTGIYLTFFFVPSDKTVVYHGSYLPLRGVHMSQAYESVIRLSFDVRAGLVMRQIHHWAALLFLAAIVAHLCRIFFTGAFRKPREINWIVGVTLLAPRDSSTGSPATRSPTTCCRAPGSASRTPSCSSIPVIGTWVAFLALRRRVPGPRHPVAPLRHPRPAGPGRDRRSC